jgi:hypothetical protein
MKSFIFKGHLTFWNLNWQSWSQNYPPFTEHEARSQTFDSKPYPDKKFGVCPHIVLLQDSITFYCSVGALASELRNFSFQISCLKCCVRLLYVIMRDTYQARCIILASLNCKMKQSLILVLPLLLNKKKNTENARYSFVDNSRAKATWETSVNCKDDIKTNVRCTVRPQRA